MELVRLTIRGYKRFWAQSTLNVDDKVIALVGSNEAGKTSFLEALLHLNQDGEFAATEYTRGEGSAEILVEATYALDDDDRSRVEGLPDGKSVRLLKISKRASGEREWTTVPTLSRDLAVRRDAVRRLGRLVDSRWAAARGEDDELIPLLREVIDDLDREGETLVDEQLERLSSLIKSLELATLPKTFEKLPTQLSHALEVERADPPQGIANRALERIRPDFLLFDDESRRLEPAYNLDGAANNALLNLLQLAGVTWDDFVQASAADDDGRISALEKRANERLEEEFDRSWSQKNTPLLPRLRIDSTTLKVLTYRRGAKGEDDYVPLSHRSDGFRQFIALRAFVAAKGYLFPVLLIDETERHLHYDAQADLVEVLTEQTDAPKVIYSTHSAGCLPRDLGNGVRVIAPITGTDYSRVENWFWQQGLGLSPLLIGMGASTFAFASARRAVIGEGITEAILLPTLVREISGDAALDYQVAPGLSNASKAAIDDLDLVAARVVYLVDGDEGGLLLREGLRGREVPEKLILVLGEGTHPDLTIEDLIEEQVFLDAVNAEVGKQTEERLALSDLSTPVRWHSVRDWCASRSPAIEEPSKRAVAQRLVSVKREEQINGRELRLVAKEHRVTVRKLNREITKLLDQPGHRMT